MKQLNQSYQPEGEMVDERRVQEMSVSRAQQRFFGAVRAAQEGRMKNASPEIKAAAKSMTTQQVHDLRDKSRRTS
jgi:hypothetical protein